MENNFDTNSYLNMELLRFTTAGSVDDGKSTLIGRLLYDSKSIFEDQVAQIEHASAKKGLDHVDLRLYRWAEGRTRARHHHRCRLSLLRYTQA